MLTGMYLRGSKVPQTSEVICVQERSDLSEGVCHSRDPAQPGYRRLESRYYAFRTRLVDLSWVCSDRHCKPVPVPTVSGPLPLLVPYRLSHIPYERTRQASERKSIMEKVITIVGKNGVEYTVSMTAEQANYYLRLAQSRAASDNEVMHEFAELIISKSKQDTQQDKVQ